jgi:predicted metalloprotease with PDZ domain
MDVGYSLGFQVREGGSILDLAYDGPAHKAGVIPSTEPIALNGRGGERYPKLVRD